jgi:hypothetical protein
MRCLDLFIKHGSILPPSHDLCEYSVLRVLIFPLRTRLLLNIGPHNTSFAIPKPLKLTSLYNNHKGPADRMRIFTTVCQAIMIHGIAAQYQIYNLTTQGTNLSSTCVGVLNQAVNCDSAIEMTYSRPCAPVLVQLRFLHGCVEQVVHAQRVTSILGDTQYSRHIGSRQWWRITIYYV